MLACPTEPPPAEGLHGVIGSISLLVGAGQIIARSRQKNEKKSDQEHIRNETRGGNDYRYPAGAQKNDALETEIKKFYFNRTNAPARIERILVFHQGPTPTPGEINRIIGIFEDRFDIDTDGVYISLPTT